MLFRAKSIDRCFDRGIQELDDQYDEANADKQSALDDGLTQPDRRGYQHNSERDLLTKSGFVFPGARKTLGRETGRANDPANAGVSWLTQVIVLQAAVAADSI